MPLQEYEAIGRLGCKTVNFCDIVELSLFLWQTIWYNIPTKLIRHKLKLNVSENMSYTVKSSERSRKSGADAETKACST